MVKRKVFKMKTDYWNFLRMLTYEDLGRLMKAVYRYEIFGELPDFSDEKLTISFEMIKTDIDEDRQKYLRTCEKNKKIAEARWANTHTQ